MGVVQVRHIALPPQAVRWPARASHSVRNALEKQRTVEVEMTAKSATVMLAITQYA